MIRTGRFLAGFACAMMWSAAAASPAVSVRVCDELVAEPVDRPFEVFALGQANVTVVLRNVSAAPVRIHSIGPRRPPGSAVPAKWNLAPGETTEVRISKPMEAGLGELRYGFTVVIEPGPPDKVCMLRVHFFVQSGYLPEGVGIVFDDVEQGVRSSRRVSIATVEAPVLNVLSVNGLPEWLSYRALDSLDPQTATMEFEVLESAPQGYWSGVLMVATDLETQPKLSMGYEVHVWDEVVPGRSRLDLGGLVLNENTELEIPLRHRRSQAFSVKDVLTDSHRLAAHVSACGQGCMNLHVKVDTAELGFFTGRVQVNLADGLGYIVLPVSAMITTADNQVKDLGEVGKEPISIEAGDIKK